MRTIFFWLTVAFFIALAACQNTAQNNETAREQASEDRKCAYCGMPYADYPKWHVSVMPTEEAATYFCAPNCFFAHKLENSPSLEQAKITVVDYYDLSDTDGKTAFYVGGSDVAGPMGKGLVAFTTAQAAQDFMADHGGSGVYQLEEVTPEVLKAAMAGQ